MRRGSPWSRLLATGLAAASLACRSGGEGTPAGARLDAGSPGREVEELVLSRAAVAEKLWNGVLLELGSPRVRPLLDEGWSYGETASDGSSFRWSVASEAAFRFESGREGTFLAWVECEPFVFEGGPSQWMQPTVNGEELPAIELRAGRARYPFEVRLRRGDNRIAWRFRYAGAPAGGAGLDRRSLAVAFYRFDVAFEGVPPVAGLPGPFSWVAPAESEPGLFVPPGGTVRLYAFAPRGGRLRVAAGSSEPPLLRLSPGALLHVDARLGNEALMEDTLASSSSGVPVVESEARIPRSNDLLTVTLRAEGRGVFARPELVAPAEAARAPGTEKVGEREKLVARLSETDANLLVIVLDGAGALRTSVHGYERETTPVLRKLAERSVVFETAVSPAVYTIASIGSFLTGQYPERHRGVTFAARLPEEAETLPARLTRAGFRTAAFSGNAVVSSAFGLDQGYEEFVPVWEDEDYTGHGDSVVAAFREWIGKRRGERFFAYVHFREPHFPYDPPPPYDSRYAESPPFPQGIRDWEVVESLNRAAASGDPPPPEVLARVEGLYDGNLAYADSLVGEVLSLLEATDLAGETIVVVTADHGEALFEHGFIGHNTQLYEESIRIPLLIHVPALAPRRVSSLVELLDLTPTLLELTGAGAASGSDPWLEEMQGKSLVPLLLGHDAPPSRLAFIRTVWDEPRYAARSETHKLVWDSRTGERELYDLEKDPEESENLVASASEDEGGRAIARVAGHLEQELYYWLRRQEHLRSRAPGPGVVLSDEERRRLQSLGYAGQLTPGRRRKR